MTKRLTAKIDEYQKDGQTKGKYIELGVILQSNDGGEYILLEPHINLAGVLQQQNSMNVKNGKQPRTNIMVSVFDNNNQGQQQTGDLPSKGNWKLTTDRVNDSLKSINADWEVSDAGFNFIVS